MSTRRPLAAVALSAMLLTALAAPASAATTRGTATSSSVPLHVEAVNLPVDIGRITLLATTDEDTATGAPWSTVGLTLLDVGGATFGKAALSSDGTTSSEGMSVGRDTAVGAVGATAANLLAVADDSANEATAAVTTLTTQAAVLNALDLVATVTDVVTNVDPDAATATHTLTLAGVDLDLANVLGTVLDELPLDTLIALADELGVTVPAGLGEAGAVVAATQTLVDDITAAVGTTAAVETAAADLLAADGGVLATLQDLRQQVVDLDPTDVVNFPGQLAAILDNALLGDCDSTVLLTQAQALPCIDGVISDHLATLDITALSDAVDAYLGAIADVVTSAAALETATLGDVLAGLDTLLADLLATPILSLGPVEVSQEVQAIGDDLAGSTATHRCSDTAITPLGGAPIDLLGCDGGGAVATAVDEVVTTLDAVLDEVEGVDGGGVSLELFGTVEDAVTEREDGFVVATSVMEVLRLEVRDITVAPCDVAVVGEVVCALGAELDPLAPLTDAVTDLEAAQTAVDTALGTVSGLVAALDPSVTGTPAASPVTGVQDAIAAVQAALDALLDGVTLGDAASVVVPGATIVVDPELEAEHQVVAATAGSPDPADPNAAPDPDDPTLPNTGGGAALVAVLALGLGAWLFRGNRRTG